MKNKLTEETSLKITEKYFTYFKKFYGMKIDQFVTIEVISENLQTIRKHIEEFVGMNQHPMNILLCQLEENLENIPHDDYCVSKTRELYSFLMYIISEDEFDRYLENFIQRANNDVSQNRFYYKVIDRGKEKFLRSYRAFNKDFCVQSLLLNCFKYKDWILLVIDEIINFYVDKELYEIASQLKFWRDENKISGFDFLHMKQKYQIGKNYHQKLKKVFSHFTSTGKISTADQILRLVEENFSDDKARKCALIDILYDYYEVFPEQKKIIDGLHTIISNYNTKGN